MTNESAEPLHVHFYLRGNGCRQSVCIGCDDHRDLDSCDDCGWKRETKKVKSEDVQAD